MTPPRGQRLDDLVDRLGERERLVLEDLARVRLLTGRLVERLHLYEGSPLTRSRRTRSLLQRLKDIGLVNRLERRIGGIHAGSAGYVYGLSASGQRITSGVGPAGGQRRRRPWEPSSWFVGHLLAVSEVYVGLREWERNAIDREVMTFDAEPRCWRQWTDVGSNRVTLKPDAFAVLGDRDLELRWFVEVDLATESRPVIQRKAQAYVDYWRSGTEQGRDGVFPRVVWLVPDEVRRTHIADALARLEPETWRLFQVGLLSEATTVLTNVAIEAGGQT